MQLRGGGAEPRLAFTLAEVLITLGIIAVVAAMTMPVLIANMTAMRYKTQFKKSLATLNQAVKMNFTNEDYDFSNANSEENASKIFTNNLKVILLDKKSQDIEDYYKSTPENGGGSMTIHRYIYSDFKDYGVHYLLPDGSLFVHDVGIYSCTLPKGRTAREEIISSFIVPGDEESTFNCVGFIDVNGLKAPNKEVTCEDGTVSNDINEPCTLSKNKINDIFPVFLYDQTIIPATNAANAALIGN